MKSSLPIHPTRRHPHTGAPLRAVWVRPDGRVCWPMLGGAPDDDPAGGGGDGGGPGGGEGGDGGQGGQGPANAQDGQGRDLGYPADTPTAEMTDGQRAAYWQHQARKHEGRVKNLTGDRTFDETRAALDAYGQIQRDQQTPAEQALNDRYEQGKKDAAMESSTKAATAILRANLGAKGLEGGEVDDIIDLIDVRKFIADDGDIDTDRLAATADRFNGTTPGTGTQQQKRRDFGGGTRGGSGRPTGAGSVAQVMADRAEARAKKNSTTTS